MKNNKYACYILWSDEDEIFIASTPEIPFLSTHGATREEALAQWNEMMEGVEEVDFPEGVPVPRQYSIDLVWPRKLRRTITPRGK